MAYESRIYVVQKSQISSDENGMSYGIVVAMFDLSSMNRWGAFTELLENSPKTELYIYRGGKKTIFDSYGDRLREMSLEDVIDALETDQRREAYRRFRPCLAMLKAFVEDNNNLWGQDLVVLHFGY